MEGGGVETAVLHQRTTRDLHYCHRCCRAKSHVKYYMQLRKGCLAWLSGNTHSEDSSMADRRQRRSRTPPTLRVGCFMRARQTLRPIGIDKYC